MIKKSMKNGKSSWGFNGEFVRNVIIFGVDNSSSHTDKLLLKIIRNLKNYFLILDEGDTFGINGSFSVREKKLTLILLRQRQSFV